MFFGFKDGQTEKDIDNLWQFFISVLNDESSVGAQFNEMTAHQYGIKFNLTIGMYWIRPEKYFPLDTPSRAFLERHGIKCSSTSVPAFKDYEQICTGVRDLLPSLRTSRRVLRRSPEESISRFRNSALVFRSDSERLRMFAV